MGTHLQFNLSTPKTANFSPRVGNVLLKRLSHPEAACSIPTPNILTSTSRGVIPHLSRDHHNQTDAIRWINIPFESFLDRDPPIPTLHHGRNPLHTFLGFNPDRHVLSMTIRDPSDGRDMPPNGNNHISAYCLRGVRKISPANWRSYVFACQPDVVVALPDTPFTNPPYSQKRLTKSIERTARWLADILRPVTPSDNTPDRRPSVLVHMAGGTSIAARRAFSDRLSETLHGKEAEHVAPLRCLDEGVVGYVFDLVPLRLSFEAGTKKLIDDASFESPQHSLGESTSQDLIVTDQLVPLIQASLDPLPIPKLRIVNTAISPHEMLRLIQTAGIDLFDAHFAQHAAQIGIALDFTFPALSQENTVNPSSTANSPEPAPPRPRTNGKRDIGHNLYDSRYAFGFSCLASCFSYSSMPDGTSNPSTPQCLCSACSPAPQKPGICHGLPELETAAYPVTYRPLYTRAYIHHLLHTHEMSAHSLLVMHNLTILDAFFAGVRRVITASMEDPMDRNSFTHEVERFFQSYDGDMIVFQEAAANWRNVDLARGKGRLAREKEKQAPMNEFTSVSD